MLSYENVGAAYWGLEALRDVSFSVADAERVGIFGHNGAGKTTLLKCAVGDVAQMSGTVRYRGHPIVRGEVHANARRGIGFVPQGHNVFRDLSVEQNLRIAGLLHDAAYSAEIYRLFPVLADRRTQAAGSLSGGEQQMLALGMALMTQPSLLLLDEPTTGLAPVIVHSVLATLDRINRTLGVSLVMVEQNVRAALRITERAIVIKTGQVIFDGSSVELRQRADLWELF